MAMIKLSEAGKILGFKYVTMYSWYRDKKIPCYNINGSLRVEEKDIRKLLRDSKGKVLVK